MGFYTEHCLPHLIDITCRQPLFAEQRKNIVPLATGIVLDVGFGSGLNLPYYRANAINQLWALEPSQGMRQKALKNVVKNKLFFELHWLALPGEEIPLDSNSVDTIVLTYTLCSINNSEQALRQMYRVLKPGGRLLFCEHGLASELNVIGWQNKITPFWKLVAGGCHLNRNVSEILVQSGFKMIYLKTEYLARTPRWLGFHYSGCAKK
ncbi:MAG: class I SAM-dependent methyltransferase [Methylococcaceae bacterium]